MAPARSIRIWRSRRWKIWRSRTAPEGVTFEKALKNYMKAVNKGLLKIFSKMGISTLQSYRGAQVFEAIGLNKALVDRYFTGTASRIEGVGSTCWRARPSEARARVSAAHGSGHRSAGRAAIIITACGGEYHLVNPTPSASCSMRCGRTISRLSKSTRT